jgi:hypothetical protein
LFFTNSQRLSVVERLLTECAFFTFQKVLSLVTEQRRASKGGGMQRHGITDAALSAEAIIAKSCNPPPAELLIDELSPLEQQACHVLRKPPPPDTDELNLFLRSYLADYLREAARREGREPPSETAHVPCLVRHPIIRIR